MNALILKIIGENEADKDLLLDELNDDIESRQYTPKELDYIVEKVLYLLSEKIEDKVYESAMNLLVTAYPLTYNKKNINEFVIKNLKGMSSGNLIHALSIIAESNIADRLEILNFYKNSENKSIKNAAIKYLTMHED